MSEWDDRSIDPWLLGAKYRCASEETAKELKELMPDGGVGGGGGKKTKKGWRTRCGASEAEQRDATHNYQKGRRKKGSVPGCFCDMTGEERDAVQAAFARSRTAERQLAARYNLTFVDTCAAFRSMLPGGGGRGGGGGGGGGSCESGNGGIMDEAAAKPYFNHPTEMQPAFFAHELKPATGGKKGGGGGGKDKKVKNRFDWLHYRYEVGWVQKLNSFDP